MAKFFVFSLGTIIVAIVIPLVVGIVEITLLGYGDILNLSNVLYLGRAFSLFTLHFVCYTALVIVLAVTTEDGGKTIIFSILFFLKLFIKVNKWQTSEIIMKFLE